MKHPHWNIINHLRECKNLLSHTLAACLRNVNFIVNLLSDLLIKLCKKIKIVASDCILVLWKSVKLKLKLKTYFFFAITY